MTESIILTMTYEYFGTHNVTVRLRQDNDGVVYVVNDFNEVMARVMYGHELINVLKDLRMGEYA